MGRKKAPLGTWNEIFGIPEDDNKNIRSVHAWDEDSVAAAAAEQKKARDDNTDITDLITQIPNDVLASSSSSTSDVGMSSSVAPTNNPSRPRAYAIAYNPNTKTVYIVFRSNAWWKYNDVGTDVWLGLAGSSSTNDYLPVLENACSSHGPADLTDMSSASWAQLSSLASSASKLQRG